MIEQFIDATQAYLNSLEEAYMPKPVAVILSKDDFATLRNEFYGTFGHTQSLTPSSFVINGITYMASLT